MREEVIILLTVHIVKDSQAEQHANELLVEEVERIRVGARRGLLGIGRERLSQAYYVSAVGHLDKGKVNAAIFDARMALHCNPRFVAAIKLKEQLLQQRDWEDDGTHIRTFVLDLIRRETAGRAPLFGRPAVQGPSPSTQPVSDAPASKAFEGWEASLWSIVSSLY